MQKIVHERRNKMSVPRLFKFAIYDEKHLEKLVKDINDHIDALYQIYTPSASDEEEAGEQEMDKLLKVVKELRSASERDPVINTAAKNVLDQSVSGGRSYSSIFNLLSSCWHRQNKNMTFNTTESTVQKIGQDQQGRYEMTVGYDASKRR